MGTFVLYLCLLITSIVSILRPWIGVLVAYVFAILTPQSIWWWAFEGVRPVLWTLLPTLIGIIILCFRGRLDFSRLFNRQCICLFILWVLFLLSSYLGSHVTENLHRWFELDYIRSLVNNIFLLYFAATLLIDTEHKLKCMVLVFIVSTCYFIYWINDQYLFHGRFGRIGGPVGVYGSSVYADENCFAMLFVTGLPFLYYFGFYLKRRLYRYIVWLMIPLGWHAVFLTGSRGGLIGLLVTLIVVALKSSKKVVGIGILILFAFAFQWQAGDTMKGRASSISSFDADESAANRIHAWKAAFRMIEDHPFIGVGLSSFLPAFPYYSTQQQREAHNTFLQISAESGITAGVFYLVIYFISLQSLFAYAKELKNAQPTQSFANLLNNSLIVSFIGLFVVSMFISLQVFELFYYICLIISTHLSLPKYNSSIIEAA